NDVIIGKVFDGTGNDCADVPDIDELSIDANVFNAAIMNGRVVLGFIGNDEVNPTLCDGTSYLKSIVTYRTVTPDCNGNNISDFSENGPLPNPPPMRADPPFANRYIVINGSNPNRLTAILVTPDDESSSSPSEWAGPPFFQTEPRDIPGPLQAHSS